MDRGVFMSRAEAESTTLAEALDRYVAEIIPHKKQAAREARRCTGLKEHLGGISKRFISTIQGKDVVAFIKSRAAGGAGPHTIRLDLALLSHLFNVARTAWGMESPSNPVELVRGQRPKLPSGRDRRLVGDELPRLLAAAHAYGGETGPLITWAIETAMRRGEIAAMRWDHLDRKARVLLIPETKTGTPRRVPLSTAALAALPPAGVVPNAPPQRPDGRVWGMRPDSISQAFERVCQAASIEGLTFHDLRHEATSRFFEQGFNLMEVASITGHKTLSMLKRYTHLRAEDLAKRLR